MITVFVDFRQFSTKSSVFLQKKCYDQYFAQFMKQYFDKNANFGGKYFKNHEIGPCPLSWVGFISIKSP
jgi:hypothetical protein